MQAMCTSLPSACQVVALRKRVSCGKITSAFRNNKAFIPFVTCGDPSLEVTEEIVYAMADAGADLISWGIPFSSPTAEGPVIQEANVRAVRGHDH